MKKYICGIGFQHELGETSEISIYDSLEELKTEHTCWEGCGVVELEVEEGEDPKDYSSSKWIVNQNLRLGRINSSDFVDKEKGRRGDEE